MRTVSIRLCDMERTCIPIGFVGENLYTRVRIDSKVVFDEYPTAIASLTVQDPNGSMYPGFISRDGDVIIWDVTASDLVYGGNGALQLAFFVDDVIAKSYICRTYVSKAMIGPGTIPTPIASWIDAANVVLGEAEEAFEALDNMTVAAETLAAGSTATAEISDVDGHKHIDFGIPKGDQGDQGEKGDTGAAGRDGRDGTDGTDGFSPTLVVSTITGGHRITITDKVGTQTVDVLDGEKGETGATGNGIASVVLNQDYTLTINYTNGQSTTTTSIRGEKGETGATGQTGATGATPIISIGTVTTGAPGSEASATMDTTDPEHPVLSMSIPEGEPGDATIDDTSAAADRVWSAQKTKGELDDVKNALCESKAPVIIDTASGEIVTVPDGADGLDVKRLTVAIEPSQDLHGQANPYPAGGGKNKFTIPNYSGSTYADVTYSFNPTTNTLSKSGTSSGSSGTNVGEITVAEGTYTFSASFSNETGSQTAIYLRDKSTSTNVVYISASSPTNTVQLNGTYYVRLSTSAGATGGTIANIQLESGSSKTAFAPYANLCPISGWSAAEVTRTGKNHCPATGWEKGQYLSGIWASYDSRQTSPFIPIIPETEYCMSVDTSNAADIAWINYNYFDENETWLGSRSENGDSAFSGEKSHSFTIHNKSAKYVRLTVRAYSDANKDITGVSMATAKPQLEFGSSATAYTPFVDSDTYTYTFPSPPGTVYGGTLTVNQDGTGSLVVDRGIVDLGSLSWTYHSSGNMYADDTPFANRKPGVTPSISSIYVECPHEIGSVAGLEDNNNFAYQSSLLGRIVIRDTRFTDAATFTTAVTGQTIVYEIATPAVYNLTVEAVSLLLGTNNLWANCGNVEIEYPCDTKLFIERLTAPSEDDYVANANIISGKFFMVGNNLYISTQAIAQGETITPGTNCTAVSLADALNAINQ